MENDSFENEEIHSTFNETHEIFEGEITMAVNSEEPSETIRSKEEVNPLEYKDDSVIATQNFPLSPNKPLRARLKSSLEYAKWSLTRYSNENDSTFNNIKRNIWCNLKQIFIFLHFKLTERADTTPQKRKFNFIDVYKSVEEDPHLPHQPQEDGSTQKGNYCLRIIQYALLEQTWLLLILLGTFCAFSAILLEFSLSTFEKGITWINDWMIDNFQFTGNVLVRLFVDIVIKLILCSIAGLIVRYVSPQAAGSGLPEMKSILSGVVLPRYLSFRTYLAKLVGLLFGIAGGLSIGMEGPFVHLSAIIANQLSKVKIFERIRKNEALRFQMLSAGCAVGISTVFGAPIGGVLFAIEKTTTYVLVQNIWKSLFAATVGALIAKLGGESGLYAMFATSFPSNPYQLWELLPHTFIGIIFGYLGGMWVRFVLKCVLVRRDYKILATTRYIQLLIIAALTAIVVFPFSAFQMDNNQVISTLFSTSDSDVEIWTERNIYITLVLFIAYKFIFTAISLGLPVPCGLYIPVFIIGAAGGRLIGEFLSFLLPNSGIIPGGYAVVGAAAMSSGVTRTLSTSIIVFEMTGQLELLIPVLIATILGTAVGNLFSDGIYETLLEQKRLPYMPPFGHLLLPDDMKNAAEMMKKDVIYLDRRATFNHVFSLIDNYNFTSYPVVSSSESMILCGEVSRKALVSLLESRDVNFANNIECSFLKHLTQSSSRDETINRLKNKYHFAPQKNDNEEEDDEDYSIVEEDLYQKRFEYFNVPICDDLEKLSNADYDRSPFQVTEGTHFFKIHFMFAMLGLNHAYITRNGSLVGIITKKDFLTKTRSFIVWR